MTSLCFFTCVFDEFGPLLSTAGQSKCVILSFHAATTTDRPLVCPTRLQAGASAGRGPPVPGSFNQFCSVNGRRSHSLQTRRSFYCNEHATFLCYSIWGKSPEKKKKHLKALSLWRREGYMLLRWFKLSVSHETFTPLSVVWSAWCYSCEP